MLFRSNDDYAGLRGYQPSDSPRHIAWKAVARAGVMLSKSFMGRAAEEMQFDWRDLPDSLDSEARISRLTRWVLLAQQSGLSYSLYLPGTTLPLSSGDSHLARCLELLATYDAAAA